MTYSRVSNAQKGESLPPNQRGQLGRWLQKARRKARLSAAELAERSGVNVRLVYDIERGGGMIRREDILKVVSGLPPELVKFVARGQQGEPPEFTVLDPSPEIASPKGLVETLVLISFGAKLRDAREKAGLSVRELARRSSTDPSYISRLERGLVPAPTWPKIAALAAILPLSELAKEAEASGANQLKHSVLESASDLEKLIVSLPMKLFADHEWVSLIEARLQKCITLVTLWAKAPQNRLQIAEQFGDSV